MRIAIGMLAQEVNTFSPLPTTLDDFEAVGISYGENIFQRYASLLELGGFMQAAKHEADIELVPTMAAMAMPGGKPTAETHQFLRQQLLAHLRGAGRLDGILLALHGAMSAEDEYDVEGSLLAEIRREWGSETPIVITLDQHANITQKLISSVTALAGYHQEPHMDIFDCGIKAAKILFATVRKETKPIVRWRKIPMIASGNLLAPEGPLGAFFIQAEEYEQQKGVLAVSIFPEFMYSDTPELGWSVVAVTDDGPHLAQQIADTLAKGLWVQRWAFMPSDRPSPSEAVQRAMQIEGGPVVLSDYGDIITGGAYGDSTAILKELLGKNLGGKALVSVVDPRSVAAAVAAGVGRRVTLEVGGKVDTLNFSPIQVSGVVRALTDGRFDTPYGPMTMKRTAVVEAGEVLIVLSEIPAMCVDPGFYRSVGLEPKEAKIVVVKSANTFRAFYAPIAKEIIIVNSPGVTSQDLNAFPFQVARRPLFPLDEDACFEMG